MTLKTKINTKSGGETDNISPYRFLYERINFYLNVRLYLILYLNSDQIRKMKNHFEGTWNLDRFVRDIEHESSAYNADVMTRRCDGPIKEKNHMFSSLIPSQRAATTL